MLNEKIQEVIRARQQLKVEESLDRFLAEPRARLHRGNPNSESAYYCVELTIGTERVAYSESRESYVDALGNALWALQLSRESEQAERDAASALHS